MTTIAILGSLDGQKFRIVKIALIPVEPQIMAAMRVSGQIDCGQRQRFIDIQVEHLHEKTRDALKAAELEVKEGFVSYFGPEAKDEAERAAVIIAREETSKGNPLQLGAVNRDIPCA